MYKSLEFSTYPVSKYVMFGHRTSKSTEIGENFLRNVENKSSVPWVMFGIYNLFVDETYCAALFSAVVSAQAVLRQCHIYIYENC